LEKGDSSRAIAKTESGWFYYDIASHVFLKSANNLLLTPALFFKMKHCSYDINARNISKDTL
jgi:hypothetical protein